MGGRSTAPRNVRFDELAARVGEEIGVSDWLLVDQEMINRYADLTGDHGFVHTDEAAAARTPFGGTIAHGLLTLSLVSNIGHIARSALPEITDRALLANYGYDKVRFTAPVPRGVRIRARFRLKAAEARDGKRRLLRYEIQVESEGSAKPVLIADWLLLVILA